MNAVDKVLISIDPGLKGAVVVFIGGKVVDIQSMPLLPWGSKKLIDVKTLSQSLNGWTQYIESINVVMERVTPRASDGLGSAGNFMQNFGRLQGMFEINHHCDYVMPQTWKTWAGLRGLVKKASIPRALRHHPETANLINDSENPIDRADAVLIGSYYWKVKMKGYML